MSLRYLLDTDVLTEPLRPEPDPGVLERLERHERHLATAAPVWHELVFGCSRLAPSRKREAIDRYLTDVVRANLPILPYGPQAASWHGRERARLAARGRTPPFVDGQIAAIARMHDLTLVTGDTSDFEGFDDLAVEGWG